MKTKEEYLMSDLRGTEIANKIENDLRKHLTKGNKRKVTINQLEFNPPRIDLEATLRSKHEIISGVTAYNVTSEVKLHADITNPNLDDLKICVDNNIINGCVSLPNIIDLSSLTQ